MAAARRLAGQALDFTDLSAVAGLACNTLNASQRRRLEIARALTARPQAILLDESLSGLNSGEIDRGVALVRAIRDRGIATLIIEHMVRVITEEADHIVVLDHGEKIADGPAVTS